MIAEGFDTDKLEKHEKQIQEIQMYLEDLKFELEMQREYGDTK